MSSQVKMELARRKHLRFIEYCWSDPRHSYHVGFHTKRICDRIDQAIEDFRNDISSYIAIAVHHRSGKSEIVSVNLPPHFLGEFPWAQVMNVTYSAGKAHTFSKRARRMVEQNERYRELYPDVTLNPETTASARWEIAHCGKATDGGFTSSGLGSGLIGSGAHLAILDDYLAGRAQAESPVTREGIWQAFTNDFMTRLMPVHIVLLIATWWHFDDVRGRIVRRTDPESEEYDPDFPPFEFLDFPARAEDWAMLHPDEEQYPGEYLFDHTWDRKKKTYVMPGMFEEKWYESQYATLGPYSSAGIMDCNPTRKHGNLLDTSGIRTHFSLEDFPAIKYYRVWDYAHSAKQRTGDDPDYTGGTLVGYEDLGNIEGTKMKRWAIWVKDYVQFRESAPVRDEKILRIARSEPNTILVERTLDSIDSGEVLESKLKGIRTVFQVKVQGDKVERCDPIEPIFRAGNVHMLKGPWNRIWTDGLQNFDGTGKTHDEMVDNLTCAYKHHCEPTGYMRLKDPFE